ncbi:MAG TPA: TIGR03790 family protein [Sedimentisphaerales bacterium]|nr:TIGR03790 family protein [Sedimentisphaerales bacterium]
MIVRTGVVILLILVWCGVGFALEPHEILVIANGDAAASVRIAQYYCRKRGVLADNILTLRLGAELNYTISRLDYEKQVASPIREKLSTLEFAGKIRCLLTTYGVPIKVGGRGPLKGREDKLQQLKKLAEQEKSKIQQLKKNSSAKQKEQVNVKLVQLQSEIDNIMGRETGASVDSELSMVLFGDYELYRWQPNILKGNVLDLSFSTLMVCRLDGPGEGTIKSLVDKAIAAEKASLKGIAYIDSRGIAEDNKPYSPGYFDRSLRELAAFTRLRTKMVAREERTEKLFSPGACPRTAIYCGWYSLRKYIDAFDFVDGAIGYHISSLEAVELRNPESSQWCPAMLKDGITATLGAVAEPYLHSFPEPRAFFLELFDGRCLVEAYYRTKPFNSWQLVLMGDPLYKPFKKP